MSVHLFLWCMRSKTEKFGQCRRKSWSSRVASSDGKDSCVIRWNQVALALPFSNHVWLPAANSPAVCHRNCISCAAVWSAVLISLMADLSRVSAAVLLAKLMNFAPQFSVWCRARTICHVAESMKILAIPFYTSCHNPPVFNTLILCLWIHLAALTLLALFSSRMMLLTISMCLPHQTHLPK